MTPTPTPASQDALARQGIMISVQTQIDQINATNSSTYMNKFDTYRQSKDNHPDLPAVEPYPELKGHVAPDSNGLPVITWGPDTCVPPITYVPAGPPQNPLGVALVGPHICDTANPTISWYQCMAGDTWPASEMDGSFPQFITSDARGSFVKVSIPWGSMYKKVG